MRASLRKQLLVFGACALTAMVAGNGCSRFSEGNVASGQSGNNAVSEPGTTADLVISLTAAEQRSISPAAEKAERRPIRHHLEAMGKVLADPTRMAIVSYAFPARIAHAHVRIGDWVEQGQRLLTLQSEEVGSAKADFYEAQAALELARVNRERENRLHGRGVGARKHLLAAEAELKVAQARLEAAEKKLHLLGFTEEQVAEITDEHLINPVITLFAPIAGKVIKLDAVRGAMVDQGTEIMVILDPDHLVVDAEVYERDIAAVDTGQAVEVSVPAFTGQVFKGTISYVSDVLDEATRTITVRTAVENPDRRLKPGMFANVNILVNHQDDVVVIPAEAVLHDDEGAIVFVRRGDQFERRVVEVGTRENGGVAILHGLSEGEQVVTRGAYQLKAKLRQDLLRSGHVH